MFYYIIIYYVIFGLIILVNIPSLQAVSETGAGRPARQAEQAYIYIYIYIYIYAHIIQSP